MGPGKKIDAPDDAWRSPFQVCFRAVSENLSEGFAREAADRVVFMDAGRIVESGAPGEIFDRPREERTRSFLSKILH